MQVCITQPNQSNRPWRSLQRVPTLAPTTERVGSVNEQLAFQNDLVMQWRRELERAKPGQPLPGEALQIMKNYPGGYVYQIHGGFGSEESVSPEAVIGGWEVNDDGEVIGEFTGVG